VILVNLLIFENLRARALLFKANITVIRDFIGSSGLWILDHRSKEILSMVRVGVIQPNIL